MAKYRYILTARPARFTTLPLGLQWRYVEMPARISFRFLGGNLPISSHPYGVIEVDRELSLGEMQTFELEPIVQSEIIETPAVVSIASKRQARNR